MLVIVLDEAVPGRFVLRNPCLDCVVEEYVLFATQARQADSSLCQEKMLARLSSIT